MPAGKPTGLAKTGGRKKGTRNKTAPDIKQLAAPYGPDALEALAGIMADPDAPAAARVAACREILYWAFGRPASAVEQPSEPSAAEKLLEALAELMALSPPLTPQQ
ncbi:MAG: hypothetical protein R3200_15460 [Xanthomonadales bacterium]|nr:hypothetical protein [Xanthomonadales bacterium]